MVSPAETLTIAEKVYNILDDICDDATSMAAVLQVVNTLVNVRSMKEQMAQVMGPKLV